MGCIAVLLYSNSIAYQNISVNGAILEVPESNVTILNQSEYYSIYNDNRHGVDIYVFDNVSSANSSDVKSYVSVIESNQVGLQEQNIGNYSYNYSEALKQYTYLTNYTNKNVFIVTKNKDVMLRILSTLHVNLDSLKNETRTTKEKTSKSTSNSKSSSSSKPKDTVNGGAIDIGGDYYQTADGKIHYGAKYYDHPGDPNYYHAYGL